MPEFTDRAALHGRTFGACAECGRQVFVAQDFTRMAATQAITPRRSVGTGTPASPAHDRRGRAMSGMLSVLDELQRELVVADSRDGHAAARARGRTGGRRPKLNAEQIALAPCRVDRAVRLGDVSRSRRADR